MRHDKAALLVELARSLAGSAEGLTLDEMGAAIGTGRRTTERMRDKLIDLFPQMEAVSDPPTKRWRIPSGLDGFLQAPTADELRGFADLVAAAPGERVEVTGPLQQIGDTYVLEVRRFRSP